MQKEEAKQRIEKLKKEIEHHRYLYHVLDRQEISDEALDSLKHELLDLEREFPEFVSEDSPTQRIGGKPLDEFKKIRHKIRQWSLVDAFSEEEILEWDKRAKRYFLDKTGENLTELSYVCELKIDGLHLVLTYEKGLLKTAATRGDGQIGEDVTNNIKTIEAVPLKLTREIDVVIEGEVFMRRSVFEKLNQGREKIGEDLLANPRNAAAGAVRQLDPNITKKRHLDFFAYDLSWPEAIIPKTQFEELEYLKTLGLKVNNNIFLAKNIHEVVKLWKSWRAKKDTKDYWLDGLVAKIDKRYYQKTLGFTGKAPRWALALKYPGEEATTIVQDIKISIGRTGRITPVAVVNPTKIAGSIVSRASLHNMDEIERLDVRVGDTVIIYKAGDIIPQVKQVLANLRPSNSRKFALPSTCPVCDSVLVKPEGEVNSYCPNSRCGVLQRRKIYHFVSKSGFNIDGLGPKIIDQLIDSGLVSGMADIFKIKENDLVSLERFAEKSASNLVHAIDNAKKITSVRLLTSLGINHIGKEIAALVIKKINEAGDAIDSLEKFARVFFSLKKENIENVKGMGPKIAESLVSFFEDKQNQSLIKELIILGVNIIPEEDRQISDKLLGQSFVFTGILESMSREEAKKKVMLLGGIVSETINRKINFLIAGRDAGLKLKKAQQLGVKIINEEDFLKLIS
jgi:DNA ligase (NAD+)